jgi:hypothetical protein
VSEVAVWESFFVAQVGASAALAGLVFVGVSINLDKIVQLANLPGRAADAIIVLIAVLVLSTLLLMPGQPTGLISAEMLAVGVLAWAGTSFLRLHIYAKTPDDYRLPYIRQVLLAELATGLLVVAGVVVLLRGIGGIYWVVPGILLCYVFALSESWVLLIEIKR